MFKLNTQLEQIFHEAYKLTLQNSYPRTLGIKPFLHKAGLLDFKSKTQKFNSPQIPIVDIRSPCEYEKGHIPGAINLPLFLDNERAELGTIYKFQSKETAIERGLKIAINRISSMLEKTDALAVDKRILVHCFRGGMRSSSFAHLLSLLGYDCWALEGGYRTFKQWTREAFWEDELSVPEHNRIVILSGRTGVGKTEILNVLQQKYNAQVLDLERLGHHKGSVFGGLGQVQPSNEIFVHRIVFEWLGMDKRQPIFIEDEGAQVGNLFVPIKFYERVCSAPIVLRVDLDQEIRIKRLVEEYKVHPKDDLITAVKCIQKRLGNENTETTIKLIENGDYTAACRILLAHYDVAYDLSFSRKLSNHVGAANSSINPMNYLQLTSTSVQDNAKEIYAYVQNAISRL